MTWEWYSEDYCCEEMAEDYKQYGQWYGGSHYHCAECGGLCSMMGHWTSVHFKLVNGRTKAVDVPEHYCCDKQNCEVA